MSSSAKPWLAYTRVSTEDQTKGASLDAQRASCEAMAKALGLTIGEVITDDLSGKDLARPGVHRAMAAVDSGKAAGVIVYKLDRLTRSRRDLEDLLDRFERADAGLISVSEKLDTSSPMGRFFVAMLGAIAQWERETIAERVQMGMDHRRAVGCFVGGPVPAGLRVVPAEGGGKRVETCPTWGRVVARAWPMITGGKSLREVAEFLTAERVPGSKRWSPASVRKIIVNQRYIGHLITAEDHARAVGSLTGRRINTRGRGGVTLASSTHSLRPWILSGIAKCGECGAPLIGVQVKNATGTAYAYYRCSQRAKHGAKSCPFREIPAEPWEAAVIARLVESVKANGKLLPALIDAAARSASASKPLELELTRLTKERDREAAALGNLVRLAAAGGLASQALGVPISERQGAINGLEVAIAAIRGQLAAAGLTRDGVDALLETVRERVDALPNMPPQEQADAARILIKSVVLRQVTKKEGEIRLSVNLPRFPDGLFVRQCPMVEDGGLGANCGEVSWGESVELRPRASLWSAAPVTGTAVGPPR